MLGQEWLQITQMCMYNPRLHPEALCNVKLPSTFCDVLTGTKLSMIFRTQ